MADGATATAAVHTQVGRGCHLYTWTSTGLDTALPISVPQAADKSVQVLGTWGGATWTLQGSNDGTNYVGLSDMDDGTTAITATIDPTEIRQVYENTVWLRPITTGGTGTSLVTSVLVRNG